MQWKQLLVFRNGKSYLLNNVLKGVLLKYDEIQTRIYMSSAYYFFPTHIDHIIYENFCLEAKKITNMIASILQHLDCKPNFATVFNSKTNMNIS